MWTIMFVQNVKKYLERRQVNNMGFLGGQKVVIDDYEYNYDKKLDVMLIKKTVREDYEISQTIKNIAKKEIEQAMAGQNDNINLILERLESLEKAIQELKDIKAEPSSQEILLERLINKRNNYQSTIEALDARIDSYYGRIARKGGEIDKGFVTPLEKEIEIYQNKIEALSPMLDILGEE